ncbi:hypothetical protein ACIBK8_09160 [Streptomyces sp. NPDC050161]|uniref:hypothetical protein n=1 Tax=Streptomyces sp. NPDC050161 TaxID=3365604 RepID=UPI0037A3213C
MPIPGFDRTLPIPETHGDRLLPQLKSYCAMECRADCDHSYEHHSPEWFECFDFCMETCH